MAQIKIHDKTFVPYISEDAIQAVIQKIADQLNADYADKGSLLVIPILNGSFMFAADLFKKLTIPTEISFIKLASYKGTKSSGQVITSIGLDVDLIDRHILILEDIIDTGKTLHTFLPQFKHQQPASLKICALFHKPEATVYPISIDYKGFDIDDRFIVGYGLDYDGLGRNLKEIYQVTE